jgi:hypothetical protein
MPALPKIDIKGQQITLDARRDTIDFRDLMYTPTLVEVPPRLPLDQYKAVGVPILNQGQEGACTGFGLATTVHYLMRTRKVDRNETLVSMRMLYEMAKRYDEFPGETYSGSSARGAMKGWHKHGVCADSLWKYSPGGVDRLLTAQRAEDARNRPLGAYFRVNHKDLVSMHSAISEVGILYVTGNVHDGWGKVDAQGVIPYTPETPVRGGHAFAIVAYDREGFWIQNSWSESWGKGGFAKITYDDWLANGMDVWVARLGVPVKRLSDEASAINRSPGARRSEAYSYVDLQPHVISLGNDGRLNDRGTYGTSRAEVKRIFERDIPRITKDWDTVRIFLYAHGGLVGESGFLQRVSEYRSALLDVQVYPLAFVWHTDLWSTVTNILKEAVAQRRPEGPLESTLDFMLDRLDDTLELIVRSLKVKGLWDEMKENAWRATMLPDGGARLAAQYLARLMEKHPNVEVHVAGHSAGSIFHAPLVQYFTSKGKLPGTGWAGTKGLGKKIRTCTLWAPGIRLQDFHETYLPAIQSGGVEQFALYTLTDDAERADNCANIYRKSLLYMVSNALEEDYGVPLLGMEKFVQDDKELQALIASGVARWVKAPDNLHEPGDSRASRHGDFDDDPPTLMSTLADILPKEKMPKDNIFKFGRSVSSLGDRRRQLG